jgi:PPK2 family polyphosphate:nucleotide phosphotransferase
MADDWDVPAWQALRMRKGLDLAELDCSSTPGWEAGRAAGEARTASQGERLSELQERLFAHGRTGGTRSVLLVLQGMDTSGKGGIVRHVLGMVDPQGVSLRSFGKPTDDELAHHYLWRIRNALPRPGQIGVFDRSHYEDVLVVRVHDLVPPEVWGARYEEINEFEAEVVASGMAIVKVALLVSPEEQKARLRERLERPDKHWKYNPGDLDARAEWPAYREAYQAVLDRTSTDLAPWSVVPADRKWFARLAVTELLLHEMDKLDLTWPEPDFDVATELARLDAS